MAIVTEWLCALLVLILCPQKQAIARASAVQKSLRVKAAATKVQ